MFSRLRLMALALVVVVTLLLSNLTLDTETRTARAYGLSSLTAAAEVEEDEEDEEGNDEDEEAELDEEIEERWAALEVLYQEQQVLTDQMKELEVTIRDLDRQAEFGGLNVLTGALENAAELEKKGGVGSFDSFIPGVDFGPDLGDLSPNGTAP